MFGKRTATYVVATVIAVVGLSLALKAQQEKRKVGFQDTPMLPGGKWHVHDGERPQPPIVTPGTSSNQETPGQPPSDATILFDGKDLSSWQRGSKPAGWDVADGAMVVPAKGSPGAGEIHTKAEFGDCQLHLEFASPNPPSGRDQGRGNSGVMFMGRYEIQVLDNFENITYADGQAGAVYGQTPPLTNASRPPGQWQTYDFAFTAPRFTNDGKLESPAYVTLFHNGVLVQNHTPILGSVVYRDVAKYSAHPAKGPLVLQDHGNPVRFRNIWIRELPAAQP